MQDSDLDDQINESEKSKRGNSPKPEQLVEDLESLGPTYVKIGQLLSSQLNFLPDPYVEALSRLQDSVKPFPCEKANQIIETELGAPIKDIFDQFDETPIAAGSLAQVYKAQLKNGKPVAIKVQRPNAKENIENDLEAFRYIATTIDTFNDNRYDLANKIEFIGTLLRREIDFTQEAENLRHLRRILGNFEFLNIPKPYPRLCTSRVLTMDYLKGRKITELSKMEKLEIDGDALAENLLKAYLEQILVEGCFHADPHPGNLFLLEDGSIGLIDLGMMGRIPPEQREHILQIVLAIVEGAGEKVSEIALSLSGITKDFDESKFKQRIADVVALQHGKSLQNIKIGNTLLDIASCCGRCGVIIDPVVGTIGKTLLQLDQVGETLSPDFNPTESIKKNLETILRKTVLRSVKVLDLFDHFIEMKHLTQKLPRYVNQILEVLARRDVGFKIDAIDEDRLIDGIERIANRITFGVIIASMYLSSALMVRKEITGISFFGMPLFSLILFIFASLGLGLLLLRIWGASDA